MPPELAASLSLTKCLTILIDSTTTWHLSGVFRYLRRSTGWTKNRKRAAAQGPAGTRARAEPNPSNRAPSERDVDRDEALQILKQVLDGDGFSYHLVSCTDYAKSHGSFRSDLYKVYHFLCYVNSMTCTKWLVCSFALNKGGCEPSKSVRVFKPNSGTTNQHEHTRTHKRTSTTPFSTCVTVSQAAKKCVAVAAGVSCALGHLPMSFTESKPGMVEFSQALLDVGKTVSVQKTIKAPEVLPCATSVTTAIAETAQKVRDYFRKNELRAFLDQGGGVTSDGLTDKLTGRKLYDFVLHYFHFRHLTRSPARLGPR